MPNELPNVKFENFAAAKSCLQTTLTSTGALVKDLSIQQDQNGKAVWAVSLASSGNFPAPTPENFSRVRAVLNQHIPHRGVLRQIKRICKFSTVQVWLWEVTYGVRKSASRLQRAITALNTVIKEVTPCLKSSPKLQTAIRKREKLSNLEQSKNRKRFFYNLRKKKSAPSGEVRSTESKPDAVYSNFVKGDVLRPTQAGSIMTKTKANVAPDYNSWDINGLFFYMKTLTVTDAKAMDVIVSCTGDVNDTKEFAAATYHLKNRCPQLKAEQLPLMLEQTLERMSIDRHYLRSVALNSDLFAKVEVVDHSYYYNMGNHNLCLHD